MVRGSGDYIGVTVRIHCHPLRTDLSLISRNSEKGAGCQTIVTHTPHRHDFGVSSKIEFFAVGSDAGWHLNLACERVTLTSIASDECAI